MDLENKRTGKYEGGQMRTEATLEQWRRLYQAATMLGEYKPWEKFWDMDLIGIQNVQEEDTVFFSILGRGGDC